MGSPLAVSSDGRALVFFHRNVPPLPRGAKPAEIRKAIAEQAEKTTVQVKVWDVTTGQEQVLPGDDRQPSSLAFSPDRKRLVIRYPDQTVKLWDLAAGQVSASLDRPWEGLVDVAFSPEGKALAVCADRDTVRLLDAATGETFLTVKDPPTGQQEARAAERGAQGNALLRAYHGHFLFARDGRRFAYAGRGGTLVVCDAHTGEVLHRLAAHNELVSALIFAPDGQRLVSAGGPEGVRIWDVQSGLELLTLRDATSFVFQLIISPDGHRLAARTGNEVLIWDGAPLAEGEPR
jgi:WD40 repeat protein